MPNHDEMQKLGSALKNLYGELVPMTFGYPSVDLITPDLDGLYRIDHNAYHAGLGISSTRIKQALISWGHYEGTVDDTPALAFGRAFHVAVLEPAEFPRQYATQPDLSGFGHPNSNIYRAEKARFETQNADKEVLKPETVEQIHNMTAALQKHPQWNKVRAYTAEIMGITTDPETGLKFKCKMDLFGGAIVDVKTTGCASLAKFQRSVLDYGYHISAAFYQDVIAMITGEKLPFVHAVVEKTAPFGVAFYAMSDEYLDQGRILWKAAAKRILKWNTMVKPERELCYGGSIRPLHPDARVIYKTKEFLDGIADL